MHSEDLSRGCSRIAASYVIHTALTEPSHGHTNSLVDSARVRLVDCVVCGRVESLTRNQCAAPAVPVALGDNLVHEPGVCPPPITGAASFRDTTATHTQTHMYDNQGPLLHRTKRGSVRVTAARARARAGRARRGRG